jgi:copper oxidase (laccase) domain-containing protein
MPYRTQMVVLVGPLYKYNHFNVDAANVQRIGTDLNVRTNKISENQFDFIDGVTETSNNCNSTAISNCTSCSLVYPCFTSYDLISKQSDIHIKQFALECSPSESKSLPCFIGPIIPIL